jgi:hypothetical protein
LTLSPVSNPADESVRPFDGAGDPASSALPFFLRADLDSVADEGGMLETAVDMVRSVCLIYYLIDEKIWCVSRWLQRFMIVEILLVVLVLFVGGVFQELRLESFRKVRDACHVDSFSALSALPWEKEL